MILSFCFPTRGREPFPSFTKYGVPDGRSSVPLSLLPVSFPSSKTGRWGWENRYQDMLFTRRPYRAVCRAAQRLFLGIVRDICRDSGSWNRMTSYCRLHPTQNPEITQITRQSFWWAWHFPAAVRSLRFEAKVMLHGHNCTRLCFRGNLDILRRTAEVTVQARVRTKLRIGVYIYTHIDVYNKGAK